MTETLYRYPGAQPFGDDEFSRRIFFGRDKASVALTDQILANRLVIVYAKSGSGKTSLLNAGVAPRLRDAGYAPLFVRVNDRKRGPLAAIFEGVRAECDRQQLEFVAGDTSSLWSFFKTVEFWRNDVLLTPVLIIDQFEELFTLQPLAEREKFLAELGSLLRGTPPATHDAEASGVSAAPPSIRVVLSLREDFLGLLDEGSDRIPEIMDHRYRLAPLSADMAGTAITGPAALEGEELATRAFRLEPDCVASIVNYLSRSVARREDLAERQVEPFHLQLICQLIESVAAFKQKAATQQVVLSFADIGGEAALTETLEDFYAAAIKSLPRKRRRAARRMCAHLLISVEGRRLSVDERELCRHSRLPTEDLRQLLERRLLRTDRRSDRTYYELGHDALVQPVLASRRTQAFIMYSSAIFGGSLVSVAMAVAIVTLIVLLIRPHSADDSWIVPMFLLICIVVGAVGYVWLRAGVRWRTRYGDHESTETGESGSKPPAMLKKTAGWALLIIAPAICIVWVIVGIVFLTISLAAALWHGAVPSQLSLLSQSAASMWLKMRHHPIADLVWMFLEYGSAVALGAVLYRQGGRMLWPRGTFSRGRSTAVRAVKRAPSLIPPSLKAVGGAVGLMLGLLGFFTLETCGGSWHSGMASWIEWPMMSDRLMDTCTTINAHSVFFSWDGILLFTFFVSIVILSATGLWNGIVDLRSVIHYRRGAQEGSAWQEALIFAAGCLVLLLVALPFARAWWKPAVSVDVWVAGASVVDHSDSGGARWDAHTVHSITFESIKQSATHTATAVGKEGAIWRTTDGGKTWTLVKWGEGDHKAITLEGLAFATPKVGWVVGEKNTLLKTEDGGNSWMAMNTAASKNFTAAGDLLDVTFSTAQDGWVAGSAGKILHTKDGGHTWELQQAPAATNVIFIQFATAECGWATGANSSLFHTVDGGETWTTQIKTNKVGLDGIGALSCSTAWVVGDKGLILHTEDGGTTWKPQTSWVEGRLVEIAFTDSRTGWAAGDNGAVVHTTDGGRRWKMELTGTENGLTSIEARK
ncbi:MAG TPA: YCF48-related protein [Acidobacteriaceae bacterium]|jgi:photosystem II stability/assembly factor-like uncharacterized protein